MKKYIKAFTLVELLFTLSIIALLSLMSPSFFISLYKMAYYPLQNTKSITEYSNVLRQVNDIANWYTSYSSFESVYLPSSTNFYSVWVNWSGSSILNIVLTGATASSLSYSWTLDPTVLYASGSVVSNTSLTDVNLFYTLELDKNNLASWTWATGTWVNDSVKFHITVKEKQTGRTPKSYTGTILF